MKLLKNLIGASVLILVLFAGQVFASSYPVGTTQFALAGAGVTSTGTALTLTSFKTPDGRAITMSNFGTVGYGALEPQTSVRLEDISFTGITQNLNGTATLTGVSRGLDFVYPYAASSTLAHSHAGGSTFIITNTPSFYYNEFALFNDSNVTAWPTASTSVATKGYADFLAFNGAAVIPATTLVPGVSQLATQLQMASSTATNGTGYSLVVPSQNATSTYNSQTAALRAVVTQNNGRIDPNFIYPVTTAWPTNNGAASSTVLENNGSGGLSWNPLHTYTLYSSTASVSTALTSTTTLLTVPIQANTINGTTQVLRVRSYWASDGNALCYYGLDFGSGTASTTVGFASAFYSSLLASDMVATTTSAESWSSDGTMMGFNSAGKPSLVTTVGNSEWTMNAFPTTNLAAKTYLAFNAVTVTSSSCKLNGVTVEVVSQ